MPVEPHQTDPTSNCIRFADSLPHASRLPSQNELDYHGWTFPFMMDCSSPRYIFTRGCFQMGYPQPAAPKHGRNLNIPVAWHRNSVGWLHYGSILLDQHGVSMNSVRGISIIFLDQMIQMEYWNFVSAYFVGDSQRNTVLTTNITLRYR